MHCIQVSSFLLEFQNHPWRMSSLQRGRGQDYSRSWLGDGTKGEEGKENRERNEEDRNDSTQRANKGKVSKRRKGSKANWDGPDGEIRESLGEEHKNVKREAEHSRKEWTKGDKGVTEKRHRQPTHPLIHGNSNMQLPIYFPTPTINGTTQRAKDLTRILVQMKMAGGKGLNAFPKEIS